jgi:hypothetical protein
MMGASNDIWLIYYYGWCVDYLRRLILTYLNNCDYVNVTLDYVQAEF